LVRRRNRPPSRFRPGTIRYGFVHHAHHEAARLPAGLIERLREAKVFASDRLDGLRLGPHVWANKADVARCLAALRAAF